MTPPAMLVVMDASTTLLISGTGDVIEPDPIPGVNGGVIKAHGSSNAKSICSTLRQAVGFIKADVVSVIKEEISKVSLGDD